MLILNPNDKLEKQPIIVRQITKKVSQNNKEYYDLQLSYGIKNYDGKMWTGAPEIGQEITPGSIAFIWGIVREFKGSLQLHINTIEKVENPDDKIMEEVMPCCQREEDDLKKEINEIIKSIKHPKLNELMNVIFSLPNIKDNFFQNAAGAEIHHAYLGGLAQHTIEVCKTVKHYASCFNFIDHDIAVSAALLHDIGKTIELSPFPENKYTDIGRLIGHIALGVQILNQGISKIEDFPDSLRIELEHCILSHHGSLETGSPVVPMTVEAITIHNADKTSAEINSFYLSIERDTGLDNWTDYNNAYKRFIKKAPIEF